MICTVMKKVTKNQMQQIFSQAMVFDLFKIFMAISRSNFIFHGRFQQEKLMKIHYGGKSKTL